MCIRDSCRSFHRREGHLKVPRPHKEAVEEEGGRTTLVALGVAVNNLRARRAKLSPEQIGELDELGMVW